MKKILLFIAFVSFLFAAHAQQDTKELHATGRDLMRQGEYGSAALVLVKALAQSPEDLQVAKDLALTYYFDKSNEKALQVVKPLLERSDADDQTFQIAGNIFRALDQFKDGEAMYKKAIKRFPKSGALYNEYGELLSSLQTTSTKNSTPATTSISQWEKGIEMDPAYPGNYYNASKYYYFTPDRIWSIIYAETFVNLEPLSNRTAEIKSVLLDSYKKLFSDAETLNNYQSKNKFENAFIQTMINLVPLAENGINPESLTMIRTRFVLDWFDKYAAQFPYRLFQHHQQLIREGIFTAYNHWIFGAAQNLTAYQNWTMENVTEYNNFNNFQRGRIFKIPAGQYYNK